MVTHSFKQHARQFFAVCILAGSLSACGAGGGNPGETKAGAGAGRSASDSSPQTAGVLTFEKPTVIATAEAGHSTTITVKADLTNPKDFSNVSKAYAYFTDPTGVILPNVQISQTGTYSYRAVMQTEPRLAVGNYKGAFIVKVCPDVNCVQHYPGSPMELPYDITVKAAGG